MMHKIQTKAKAFGTFVSPTTGSILYVDPTHDDEAHHSPTLTLPEANEAFMRGLIEDPDNAKAVVGDQVLLVDPNTLDKVALERSAELGGDTGLPARPGTVESRDSTAWSDHERVRGDVEGFASGAGDDADAPPSTSTCKKPGPKPKSAGA